MKKFIAMLLALAMVLSLAACGSKTDAPAETKAQTAAEKPAATEKTEEPAPAAEPVTLTWGSWVFAEDSVRPIYQEMADLYNETNEYNTTISTILSANQLETEEEIPREKLLLIPRKRA